MLAFYTVAASRRTRSAAIAALLFGGVWIYAGARGGRSHRHVGALHTDPGGHGLAGMRERARLYGGALTAGPRPQGGFEVVLVLPTPVEMGQSVDTPPG